MRRSTACFTGSSSLWCTFYFDSSKDTFYHRMVLFDHDSLSGLTHTFVGQFSDLESPGARHWVITRSPDHMFGFYIKLDSLTKSLGHFHRCKWWKRQCQWTKGRVEGTLTVFMLELLQSPFLFLFSAKSGILIQKVCFSVLTEMDEDEDEDKEE